MEEKCEFLEKESIGKLLFKLSIPVIIGMLVQAIYNVVDTFFVGLFYGTENVQPIGGLSIAFPVQMIIMAFGIVLGTGGSSIISRALGARESEKAEKTLGNVLSLSLSLSAFIALPCLLYLDPILKVFGATSGVLPYAKEYLQIIIIGGLFFVSGVALQNIVRAEGNTRLAMNAMLVGGGLNLLLDPIFMFGFDLGVRGAAIATVLSQAAASICLLQYYLNGKSSVRFRTETLKPDLKIIKAIGTIGFGSFIMECSSSIMMIFVYNALSIYGGDIALAVFGIIMRINSFIFLPILGIAFGLQPIVGYNYGARKFERIGKAVKLSLATTTIFGFIGLILVYLFAEQLLSIFNTSPTYLAIGKNALVIIILGTPLIGLNVVTSTLFQALGKARPAFLLSVCRQLLFLIPAVIFLPRLYELKGVWAAFPVSDFLAFILSGLMLLRINKLFKKRKSSLKYNQKSEPKDKTYVSETQ
ncbi:MAG: MATE family efflux transporter [Methanosarcinaceae archaeon]|nr:MATE family efflux transporter [Methanosarcinaceae archaeon]MDD4331270.1 MATE family efflux transporter [Methanosarcinaceae archaeon]MDD4748450.1 MATE family efflux transporter [Methanosarcinaceae archaeon]